MIFIKIIIHYSLTITNNEILYYDKLPYILAYEAIDMITNINNNVQEHFIDHLNKYVHIVFDIKAKRNEITKIIKIKLLENNYIRNYMKKLIKLKRI